jgi:glutathione S-transferase
MEIDIASQVETLAARVDDCVPERVSKPTLVYFDIVGICWPIRCLLHLKQVDYDLVTVPLEAWAYRTPNGDQPLPRSFRNGHVPLYVDPDVSITQSQVIMMYLGEQHDLLGDNTAERLAAMEVMAHAYDAIFHWSGLFQIIVRWGIPDDVVETRTQAFLGNGTWGFVGGRYAQNLDAFERYLDANPKQDSGFMVGSRLSIADLYAFNVLCNWYKAFDRELFIEKYPRLDDYIRRIAAIPAIKDYIDNHQEHTLWFPIPQFAARLTSPEDLEGLIG